MRPKKRRPVKCLNCGKEFLTTELRIREGRGKFCSKKCAYAYRKGKPNPKRRRGEERKCPVCGKMFYAKLHKIKEGKGKYCSKACANKSHITKVSRVCLNCGKTFIVKNYRIREGAKYCGVACASEHRIKGNDVVCPVCGKPFHVMPSRAGQKYCSNACSHKSRFPDNCVCVVCGKRFHTGLARLKLGWGKTCSNKCKWEYTASLRKGKQLSLRVKRICEWCNTEFYRTESEVKREATKYCSYECYHLSQVGKTPNRAYPPRVERTCIVCGKHFTVVPSVMQKTDGGKYCSTKCHGVVLSQKWADPEFRKKMFAACGKASIKGSVPERYAFYYISTALKGVEVNLKDWYILGNQEIDISIPIFKVGIEYQGPIHSLPIRGQKILESRQKSDKKKLDRMEAMGWRLFYIHGPRKLRINELEEACDKIIHQLPGFADWKPPQRKLRKRAK